MSGSLLCTDIENQTDADADVDAGDADVADADVDADGEDDGLTSFLPLLLMWLTLLSF